ncbi:MAG: DUF58 domain-containing protein [Brevinematia bacterium]
MPDSDIPIQQIISQVKHLEIKARKLIEDTLLSEYHSVFKGKGIEFHETRNYLPGDDIRDIDWNVTARMNEPFVKTYIEERQLTIIFALDISNSNSFGVLKSKRQKMAEIVAFLGFTALFNNDRVGLVLFSNDIERYIPPKKKYSHLLRIIRDSWYYNGKNKTTSLSKSFKSIFELFKKKAVIFILSDFLDKGYEKNLLSLAKKHDVIAIVVNDFFEKELSLNLNNIPFANYLKIMLELKDSETERTDIIKLDKTYTTRIKAFQDYYRSIFKKCGLDYAEVDTSDNLLPVELILKKRVYKR